MRELALHVLDIAQNAEAAGAATVAIRIVEDTAGDSISLSVTDDGKGMDEETIARVTDPFYTTRTTRKVGLGLPLLRSGALACGGSFSIESKVGEGTVVTATYPLRHIDRPPLGDIASTMLTILLGNQEIDYIYTHDKDGASFSFASKEMKEALEGVSFTQPDVYAWLKEFLAEGEKTLDKSGI